MQENTQEVENANPSKNDIDNNEIGEGNVDKQCTILEQGQNSERALLEQGGVKKKGGV